MGRPTKLAVTVMILLAALSLASGSDAPVLAQEGDNCPAIVQAAIEATDAACRDTGRNQACYGNTRLEAIPQTIAADFVFARPGDIEEVGDVQAIQASPLDQAAGDWGIALLRIQADLPETLPGQNVTLVLFGDVQLENAGATAPPPVLSVTAAGNVNLRGGPSTGHPIVGSLRGGESVRADGRLADGSWLRVRHPESGGPAWVFASLVTPDGDVNTLTIIEPGAEAPVYGPMQAFYFRTGLDDAPCAAAPASGILIQTPQGAGQVTLNMNGVELALGSTALVQGGSGLPAMNVVLLEGTGSFPQHALDLYGGQYQPLLPQDGVWVPAGDPQPLDASQYAYLPLDLLPRRVDICERHVISSGPHDIVSRYCPPPPDASMPDGAAILVHGRGLDHSSWDWLAPWLLDRGWAVLTPDMPGHGQTGGADPAYGDWAAIITDLVAFAQARGHQQGVIIGSSIGANSGLAACAGLPDWCRGAGLLSPGINYFGVETPGPMGQMGDRPVFIITSEHDARGGPGDVARQIAAYGRNVTVQVYPGDLHGTDLSSSYDLTGWLADYVFLPDFLHPDIR